MIAEPELTDSAHVASISSRISMVECMIVCLESARKETVVLETIQDLIDAG
jgi:hypothetical protein